jgi:DNA-binding NarL/FixJ family response regulator
MRRVVLVDDNEILLGALAEFLEVVAGVECLRFRGLSELAEHETDACDSRSAPAILDINLGYGQPSGIEVYHWLRHRHFPGKIAFLTAHAEDHPLVIEASLISGAKVFSKPMDVEKLLALIQEQHEPSE